MDNMEKLDHGRYQPSLRSFRVLFHHKELKRHYETTYNIIIR